MSQWNPYKRRIFIKKLKSLDFDGPFSGARHQFMFFHEHRLAIPSNAEYSVPQLKFMLREIELILGRTITSFDGIIFNFNKYFYNPFGLMVDRRTLLPMITSSNTTLKNWKTTITCTGTATA